MGRFKLNFKLKSIRSKMILVSCGILLLTCAGFGILTYYSSSNILTAKIDDHLLDLAKEGAKTVKLQLEGELDVLGALAESHWMKSRDLTVEEKIELLKNEMARKGHSHMLIADTVGKANVTNGTVIDIKDREYFTAALAGKQSVSGPLVNKADNSLTIVYTVPIKDGKQVVGVLAAARDGNVLSEITAGLTFGQSGEAFMINKAGEIVAHNNQELVLSKYNALEEVKNDPELQSLVELEKQMIEGKEGLGEYTYRGDTKYMAFVPVEGTEWSIAVTALKSEVMAGVRNMITLMVGLGSVFLILGVLLTIIQSSSIVKPLQSATEYLNIVATGDFTVEVPAKLLKMEDETGILAKAISTMQDSIKTMIKKVARESDQVSQILDIIHREMEMLYRSTEEISATTEEVSSGSEETASSTEETNATAVEIENAAEAISTKAQESVKTVNHISTMAGEMKQNAEASRQKAHEIYEKTKKNPICP